MEGGYMKPERDSKGRWKKGSSGNPEGRRRAIPDNILCLFEDNTEKAIRRLIRLMKDSDPSVSLAATKYFIDKGLGAKFSAFIDDTSNDTDDIKITIVKANNEEDKE